MGKIGLATSIICFEAPQPGYFMASTVTAQYIIGGSVAVFPVATHRGSGFVASLGDGFVDNS